VKKNSKRERDSEDLAQIRLDRDNALTNAENATRVAREGILKRSAEYEEDFAKEKMNIEENAWLAIKKWEAHAAGLKSEIEALKQNAKAEAEKSKETSDNPLEAEIKKSADLEHKLRFMLQGHETLQGEYEKMSIEYE
jgi:hypothetical protein